VPQCLHVTTRYHPKGSHTVKGMGKLTGIYLGKRAASIAPYKVVREVCLYGNRPEVKIKQGKSGNHPRLLDKARSYPASNGTKPSPISRETFLKGRIGWGKSREGEGLTATALCDRDCNGVKSSRFDEKINRVRAVITPALTRPGLTLRAAAAPNSIASVRHRRQSLGKSSP
jgi:hypothetical protein